MSNAARSNELDMAVLEMIVSGELLAPKSR